MTDRDQEERRGQEKPKRSRPPLPVREILAAAARAARSDPWRIIAVAVAVSLLTVLADFVVTDLLDKTDVPLLIATTSTSWLLSVFGTVFLSGFLCRIVGQAEHGRERSSIWQVARHLPWSRLVRADVLVFGLVVLGVIALVIPGVAAFILFALSGPVIEIENRPVRAALRRSARLVRPHFWWVALFCVVPLAVPIRIQVGSDPGPGAPTVGHVVEEVVLHGFVEALIEAAVGLVLVELCFRLIALDQAAPGPG